MAALPVLSYSGRIYVQLNPCPNRQPDAPVTWTAAPRCGRCTFPPRFCVVGVSECPKTGFEIVWMPHKGDFLGRSLCAFHNFWHLQYLIIRYFVRTGRNVVRAQLMDTLWRGLLHLHLSLGNLTVFIFYACALHLELICICGCWRRHPCAGCLQCNLLKKNEKNNKKYR